MIFNNRSYVEPLNNVADCVLSSIEHSLKKFKSIILQIVL